MKNKIIGIIWVIIISLSACNTKEDDTPPNPGKTGVFIDSKVENLEYQTAAGLYLTNGDGEFNYQDGDTITFSIGALTFPSVVAEEVITPLTLARTESITNQEAINITRLLLSLDIDGNPDNGISIPPEANAHADQDVDFNVDPATFENYEVIQNLVTNSGSVNTNLLTVADAQAHLGATINVLNNPSIVGAWRIVKGAEFAYLILLSDNTFLYAENDLTVESDEENGLEAGTYMYDTNNGSITFNIVYDDNAPSDNDSGIGSIGTPVTTSAVLSNGNTKLSLADGVLNFNYVGLTSSPIVGVWRLVNGEEFGYLTLFSNHTFVYAENDLDVESEEENGLEVGTYVYDSNNGIITFNIVYDDNTNPYGSSGIGSIGTPSTTSAVLSSENNTLTIAGFALSRAL